MSNEKFTWAHVANVTVCPKLVWVKNTRKRLKFKGSCLKQESFIPNSVVNLFIVYELVSWPSDLNTDFTVGGCLFESVKLTKNAQPDKYSCNGYDIEFDTRGYHSLPDGSVGKNFINFLIDMSSSVHIDNKGKDILILNKGPTEGLNHTLTAEAEYSINFYKTRYNILFNPAL